MWFRSVLERLRNLTTVRSAKELKAVAFLVSLLIVFVSTYSVSAVWNSAVRWYTSHAIQTDREEAVEAILVVALDDRMDGTEGLPDTLMLYWPQTNAFKSIDRGWVFSRLDAGRSLVELYLRVPDCKTFCGIQGVYAQNLLLNSGLGTRENALEQLRQVIASEYELNNLGLVVFDLQWAKSFFKCLGPLEIEVLERLPIGGRMVDGRLQDFRDYIEPGIQMLSPLEVYWFARSRAGSSNSERISRQEQVAAEILNTSSRSQVLSCAKDASGYLAFDFDFKDFGILFNLLIRKV
jgi:hypothetical protein